MPQTDAANPIARRMKDLREELGLSQEDLSALSGGLDRRQISAVEHGLNKLTSYALRVKFARALGFTLGELEDYLEGRMDARGAARLSRARFPRLGDAVVVRPRRAVVDVVRFQALRDRERAGHLAAEEQAELSQMLAALDADEQASARADPLKNKVDDLLREVER